MSHYTYRHRAGYGREDHLADELIARAIRQLGISGVEGTIAAHLGLTSHAVPVVGVNVVLPARRGVKARMLGALRRARREVGRYWDCAVTVVRCDARGEEASR